MKLRIACLAALLVAAVAAAPALAHPGHGGSGFLHPFTGMDHLLAMVGVGMWAWLLSEGRRSVAVLVPMAFIVMMALGAAAGFAGIKMPFAEAAVLASVFLLGGLVLAAIRMPTVAAMAVVGLFAVFHGYVHAVDAPSAEVGTYMLGFLAATALLHAAGMGVGWLAQRAVGNFGVRALGGLIVAGGALVLAAQ